MVDQQNEQKWDGSLREGELVTLDTTVVTRSFNKAPISITTTNLRLRFGQAVFDLDQLTSCSSRQWVSKDDFYTVKITHGTRFIFSVTGNGKLVEIEFSADLDDNVAVWSHLAKIAKQIIEPKLVEDTLKRLRSGNSYSLKAGDGRILLGLSKESFVALEKTSALKRRATDKEITVPWSEYAGVSYGDETGVLTITRPGLNPIKSPRIKCDSWHAQLMDACAQEFR